MPTPLGRATDIVTGKQSPWSEAVRPRSRRVPPRPANGGRVRVFAHPTCLSCRHMPPGPAPTVLQTVLVARRQRREDYHHMALPEVQDAYRSRLPKASITGKMRT